MSSTLGTPLPRRSPAWFWVAVAAVFTASLVWTQAWAAASVLGGITLLIYCAPRFGKTEYETVQVDDSGVLRIEGELREQVAWNNVNEVRIVTTDEGPYREDVFFLLMEGENKGCVVPHEAAVRTDLLQELQRRFAGLDDATVIKAMGSTSNNTFVIWKRPASNAT